CAPDQRLFELLARGEFCISGFRNRDLRQFATLTSAQISHLFKRLRSHGLIKKIAATYKYYLTTFGRHVILTGLKLKNLFLLPALAH
ncbi:MAG: MarR family transcriptional regulator, partial [Candidatus Binatia bacterium]